MDEDVTGIVIFGVALAASLTFFVVRRLRSRTGLRDVRPTDRDPRAQAVVASLRAGSPGALIDLLRSLGTDWDTRGHYLKHLLVHCSRESLDVLCAQQPSPLALLVRGCHAIDWAWQARGRGSADTVSRAAMKLFHERLALAERDLTAAAAGDPADPTPHANLIIVAKGTSAPREVAWRHFSAAVAREPDNFLAHEAMRSLLSRRWGGSDEEMFDFVRRCAAAAPRGSDLPMLIVDAHLDVWSHILTFNRNPERAAHYLSQPAVRQEIEAAYAQTLAGPCRVRASTIHLRNSAAFFFFQTQNVPWARVEHERIAGAYTEFPWVYSQLAEQETSDVITMARMVAGLPA